uniref:HELP domain-containing protein n=1 Tax=Heterorhabditis bacteriophora TaxID=37862 RepID=A0A1I7WNK3_HETBA
MPSHKLRPRVLFVKDKARYLPRSFANDPSGWKQFEDDNLLAAGVFHASGVVFSSVVQKNMRNDCFVAVWSLGHLPPPACAAKGRRPRSCQPEASNSFYDHHSVLGEQQLRLCEDRNVVHCDYHYLILHFFDAFNAHLLLARLEGPP